MAASSAPSGPRRPEPPSQQHPWSGHPEGIQAEVQSSVSSVGIGSFWSTSVWTAATAVAVVGSASRASKRRSKAASAASASARSGPRRLTAATAGRSGQPRASKREVRAASRVCVRFVLIHVFWTAVAASAWPHSGPRRPNRVSSVGSASGHQTEAKRPRQHRLRSGPRRPEPPSSSTVVGSASRASKWRSKAASASASAHSVHVVWTAATAVAVVGSASGHPRRSKASAASASDSF